MVDQIRILHVDDDPALGDLVATYLEQEDERFSVTTAANASEGLKRLSTDTIDCVVSDYDMPGRTGIEFLEAVRADSPNLPFILYTGKGSEEVASEAISAGVTDYLQKERGTEQYEILANRIQNTVEHARSQRDRQRHLDAIETAQEGVSILNEDSEFIYVNEAYADLYGYDAEDLLGEHWEVLYRDEDTPRVHNEILPVVETDGYWRGETIGLRADGSTFVEDHTLATSDDGELICTVRDITERTEREQAIEELHSTAWSCMRAGTAESVANIAVEAVRDILDLPVNGVYSYDEEENHLSPVAWTDYSEELIGEPPTFGPDDGLAWQAFETGEVGIYDDLSSVSGGINPDTNVRSELILPLGDHGVLMIGSAEIDAFNETDISLVKTVAAHMTTALNRIEREQELRRQNEQLEQFASVVSHDLRNPLNIIQGRLELAREECDSPHLDYIASAVDRSFELLDDLFVLAHEGAAVRTREAVNLADISSECWKNVDTAGATLIVEAEQTTRADRSRLKQLLENMLANAAIHGGEGVTVTVGDLDDGFYVADDGPGIPAAKREQVFETGYSTADAGIGLGLNIIETVADAHGWDIRLTESEAGGARFEVTEVESVR